MDRIELNSLSLNELEKVFTDLGEKPFRAKQLFEHMHKHKIFDLDLISVFSGSLKNKLKAIGFINNPQIACVYESKIDKTKKFLIKLQDKSIIETIFMDYGDRKTLCISSQVGCKMGCTFCASTKAKFRRDLTSGEIVSQIYLIENYLSEKINNIVFMGIGEPLDNYDNVVKAIRFLNDEKGKNLSQRAITLSTSGLANKIDSLAEENLSINLAISLHYPSNWQRKEFMPVNKKFPIETLMAAADRYFEKTGRRVSFEYVLIKGLNDSDTHIRDLHKLFEGKNIHINLIPLNEINEFDYEAVDDNMALNFQKKLKKAGINSTIRQKKGIDIDAACGQLRISYEGSD